MTEYLNHSNITDKQLRQFMNSPAGESLKSGLSEKLKEFLKPKSKEEQLADTKEAIAEALTRFAPFDFKEHIDIQVSATPEEIAQKKMTVKFIALDEIGAEFIQNMQNARKEMTFEISNQEESNNE